MILFAVQALFNGLAWAAWVCTYFMNALFNSMLKENFLTHKHLSWLASKYLTLSFGHIDVISIFMNHVSIRNLQFENFKFWKQLCKTYYMRNIKILYALRVSCARRELECFFYERICGSKSTSDIDQKLFFLFFFIQAFLNF